ncbi:MAG: hypothetical protein HRU20_27240 [Pseudomonadales bacterium]|nr:hypothetical protein [Pseudomonadales bacterium]
MKLHSGHLSTGLTAAVIAVAFLLFFLVNAQIQPLLIESPSPTGTVKRVVDHRAGQIEAVFLQQSLANSSLSGSEVDRAYVVDENGDFLITPAILLYFDYFLSLEGELEMKQIHQMVSLDIQRNYPAAIAAKMNDLFLRYTDYLQAISDRLAGLNYMHVVWQGLDEDSVQAEIQVQYFSGLEIESLFQAYEDMLSFESESSRFEKKYAHIEKITRLDPQQQQAVVTELFGTEAAGRMQQLQQDNDLWRQRLARYQQEKSMILFSENLDDFAQQQSLTLLQQRAFSATEMIRVNAIEGIQRGGG